MGFIHPDNFKNMYDKIRGFIPEGSRQEVAGAIYDEAQEVGCDVWDGNSDLERDGRINQNLKD